MQRRAHIAVSALITISAVLPCAAAQTAKKSVALVPAMVPGVAPHPVPIGAVHVSRTQLQRLARTSYPSNHLQKALLLKQKGDLDDALVEFLKAAQENPLQVRAFYEQALIFKQKGYNKLAQSALQQALAIQPGYRDARVLLASLYLDSGAITSAAQELFRSLGLNPAMNTKSSGVARADVNAGAVESAGSGSGSVPYMRDAPPASALPLMQTPHGHLFSPLSAMSSTATSAPRRPVASGIGPADAFSTAGNNSAALSQTSRVSGDTKTAPLDLKTERRSDTNAFAAAENHPQSETSALSGLLKGIPGVDPQASWDGASKQRAAAAGQQLTAAPPAKASGAQEATTAHSTPAPSVSDPSRDGDSRLAKDVKSVNGVFSISSNDGAVSKQLGALVERMKKDATTGDMQPQSGSETKDEHHGFHFPNLFAFFKGSDAQQSPPYAAAPKQLTDGVDRGNKSDGSGDRGGNGDLQDERLRKLVKTAKAQQKDHHVAGWVDGGVDAKKLLSRAGVSGGQSAASVFTKHKRPKLPKNTANPIEMLIRQSTVAGNSTVSSPGAVNVTETLPDGINMPPGQPAQLSAEKLSQQSQAQDDLQKALQKETLPPSGVRTETITTGSGNSGAAAAILKETTAADAAGHKSGSWLPAPLDFTRFIRKAMSWVPLPIFKPLIGGDGTRPSAVAPALSLSGSGGLGPAPSPVLPGRTESSALPRPQWLAPQAHGSNYNIAANNVPAAVPQPAVAAGAGELAPRPEPKPEPSSGALSGVLGMLPKDLAAGLAQVLTPKPVEVSADSTSPPQVQNINVQRPDASRAPSPVPALNKNVFDNLVTARVGPDAVAETEAKVAASAAMQPRGLSPSAATHAVPLPAPLPAPLPVPTPADAVAAAWQYATSVVPQLHTSNTQMPAPDAPSSMIAGAANINQHQPPLPQLAPRSSSGALDLPVPLSAGRAQSNLPSTMPVASAVSAARSYSVSPQPAMLADNNQWRTCASTPQPVHPQESHMDNWQPPQLASLVGVRSPAANRAPQPVAVIPNTVPGNYEPLPPNPHSGSAQVASSSQLRNLPIQSRPVAQRLAKQGFRFVAPNLPVKQRRFLSTIQTAASASAGKGVGAMKAQTPRMAPIPPPEPPEDKWTKRMKYLMAYGTSSLGPGEAFMYSEETGEGVMFMPDGTTIKRKLADPRDAEEVALQRRPDILAPKGQLQYNLSLLGKIIKGGDKGNEQSKAAAAAPQAQLRSGDMSSQVDTGAPDDFLNNPGGFFGWLKNVFKF